MARFTARPDSLIRPHPSFDSDTADGDLDVET